MQSKLVKCSATASDFHNIRKLVYDTNNQSDISTVMLCLHTMLPLCVSTYTSSLITSKGHNCYRAADCGYPPGLGCVNHTCDYCRKDTHCGTSHQKCTSFRIGNDLVPLCIEKNLFEPFTQIDFWVSLLAFISTSLGSGCGVGGGGLLVPLYILLGGLSPKHAIPLSKATIFGNAIAIYWINHKRDHIFKEGVPLINYALAALMEPPTLAGTIFGVILNHIFPNWLILLMLLMLLSYISLRTFRKGMSIRERETARKKALLLNVFRGKVQSEKPSLWSLYPRFSVELAAKKWLEATRRKHRDRIIRLKDEKDFESLPALKDSTLFGQERMLSFGTFDTFANEEIKSLLVKADLDAADSNRFPLRYITPLVFSWLLVLAQALLRGGHGATGITNVECNTFMYWILTIIPVVILGALTYYVGYRLRLVNRLRVYSNFQFVEGDIHWTRFKTIKISACCIVAGMAAGLLGIGGGMIKGPLMLEIGIIPAVQSSTASFMILFTASSTTLQFAVAGQFPGALQYDYLCWYALMGFLGGFFGQYMVAYSVKKYKRESIIVFILATTIGISAICMTFVGFDTVRKDITMKAHLGFSSLCETQ